MPPSSAGRQVLRVRRTSEAEEDGSEHGLGELLSTTVDAADGGDEPRGRCGGRVTIVRARGTSYAVSARSFGCVPAEHPLRRRALDLVTHRAFDAAVLAVIGYSSILLALTDYSATTADGALDAARSWRNALAASSDAWVCTPFFAAELAAKVLAFGLCGAPDAYLSSAWNRLDALVVAAALAEYADSGGVELSGLRVLRVLRPLRALRRFPRVQMLAEARPSRVCARVFSRKCPPPFGSNNRTCVDTCPSPPRARVCAYIYVCFRGSARRLGATVRPPRATRADAVLQALAASAPQLGVVLVLLGFLFVLFGVAGVQLFGSATRARCRLTPFPVTRAYDPADPAHAANVSAFACAIGGEGEGAASEVFDTLAGREAGWAWHVTERKDASPWWRGNGGDAAANECWWPLDEQQQRACALDFVSPTAALAAGGEFHSLSLRISSSLSLCDCLSVTLTLCDSDSL